MALSCVLFTLTELIEGKVTGVFSLLDEESKLPRPTPDHFTAEVHARNKSHYRLCVSQLITKPTIYDLMEVM